MKPTIIRIFLGGLVPVGIRVLLAWVVATAPSFAASDEFKIGDFTFQTPPGWTHLPGVDMTAARIRVPNPNGGEAARVVFYRFAPGTGGSARENLARWRNSFRKSPRLRRMRIRSRASPGRKTTYFSATGTLIGADVDLPDHTLQAAMLEGRASTVIVRFAAPAGLAGGAEEAFQGLIEGALRRKP